MGLEEGVRRRREGVGGAENDGETRRRRERKLTRLSLSLRFPSSADLSKISTDDLTLETYASHRSRSVQQGHGDC